MDDSIFDYAGYYLIVLTQYSSKSEQSEVVLKILSDCWSKYIVNVNIIAPFETYAKAIIYTYFPFTQSHCEQVIPVDVNFFINNSLTNNSQIFADKLENMHKCEIIVSLAQFQPFTIVKWKPNGDYLIDGIDGHILGVISDMMNFTTTVKYITEGYDLAQTVLDTVRPCCTVLFVPPGRYRRAVKATTFHLYYGILLEGTKSGHL